MLSNVKGLAAVKVTSLIDAFNKPFLVGGLHRPEAGANGEAVRKAMTAENVSADGFGQEEVAEGNGSPDWPEQQDEPSRRTNRGRTPSRSPGLSPERRDVILDGPGEDGRGAAEAWHDPLEDEEDPTANGSHQREDEDEDEDEDESGPATKRARVDR